jgi:hypothetical protein
MLKRMIVGILVSVCIISVGATVYANEEIAEMVGDLDSVGESEIGTVLIGMGQPLVTRPSNWDITAEEAQELAQAFDNGTAVARTPEEIEALPEFSRGYSSYVLPNRVLTGEEIKLWVDDYRAHGGVSDSELEFLDILNKARVELGLNKVVYSEFLSMAARFNNQHISDIIRQGIKMRYNEPGPYGGSKWLRSTALELGDYARGLATAGSMYYSNWSASPTLLFHSWSKGKDSQLFDKGITYIGLGHVMGGFPVLMLSRD